MANTITITGNGVDISGAVLPNATFRIDRFTGQTVASGNSFSVAETLIAVTNASGTLGRIVNGSFVATISLVTGHAYRVTPQRKEVGFGDLREFFLDIPEGASSGPLQSFIIQQPIPPISLAAQAQAAAAASAAEATTQAGIATTQAGIATNQAGIATTQAGIATNQAGIAADQATAAGIAAIAAGAPIVSALTDPVPADGSIELLTTEPGMQVWEVQSGAWEQIGWFGEILFQTVTQLLDWDPAVAPATGTIIRTRAEGFSYEVAASSASDHHVTTAGGVKLYVLPGPNGRAAIEAFGCRLDGMTDDTSAFQAAFDSALRLSSGKGTLRLSDTILLDPGADFEGAGGVANYAEAALQLHFEPPTKRDIFKWKSPQAENYEFAGCRLSGFTVRGFGPGADACVDLPLLYNGRLDFFAFAGIDRWLRIRRWMDTYVKGGVQGFRVAGVHFSKAGSVTDPTSDVTTTTCIDAYVSQGPTAYLVDERSVTEAKIKGTIESADAAVDLARGNVLFFDVYTENVPRTDSGSAWLVGKTGTAPAFETALHLSLRPGIGHTGGTLNNANLIDVDVARLVKVSGYTYLYATLLKTSANTQKVLIDGLDTDNIAAFSTSSGIADFSKITLLGFTPRTMTQVPGGPFFIDAPAKLPALDFFEVERGDILPGQIFRDAGQNGKLILSDKYNNFTAPIGALRVAGTSGWTVQGGRLVPGELVQNTEVTRGEPGLWVSTRYTKDAGNAYFGCSTTAGSPVITNPTIGHFFLCEVGDYVTVSAGYADPVLQRRVIARSADLTAITLDSNATSTVTGTVIVATESHNLIPLAQQGHREITIDPDGALVANFVGEEVLRTDTHTWYKATGQTSTSWKAIT